MKLCKLSILADVDAADISKNTYWPAIDKKIINIWLLILNMTFWFSNAI